MTRFSRSAVAGVVLPLLLAIPACSLFFQRPSVSVVDVRVGSVGLRGATAEITLEIDNPNPYDLGVTELRYTLAVPSPESDREGEGGEEEWTVLLDGSVPDSTTVPGGRLTRVVVDVPFEYSAVGLAGESFLRRGARLPYRLRGQVRVNGPMAEVQVPFDEEGVLDPLVDLLGK